MLVRDAKAAARQWIEEKYLDSPVFEGAFFTGSVNELPDNVHLPEASDVDMMVMLSSGSTRGPGKFVYRKILLEVSCIDSESLPTPESILRNYHLAHAFSVDNVVLDPAGRLSELQVAVAEEFAGRDRVRQRRDLAEGNALRFLHSLYADSPLHEQVTAWLFGAGVTTHVLLVAGLKNPTVRKRYVAARELLEEYEHLEFHEEMLDLLGCTDMSRARTEHHLDELSKTFDAAGVFIRTPFFFASDISEAARPVAVDGSRDLIRSGLHREAVFWILATYARCQSVFHQDAPEMEDVFMPGFLELLSDLGVGSRKDLQKRAKRVEKFLPRVRRISENIIAANPGVRG